jgi:hypothetical protein
MADTDNPNTIPALVAAATGIAALDIVEALDRVEDAITRCETTLLSLGISQAQATEEGLSLLREAFWKFAERVENTEIEKGDPQRHARDMQRFLDERLRRTKPEGSA